MSLVPILTLATAVVAVLLLLVLVWRTQGKSAGADLQPLLGELRDDVREDTARGLERLEREVRTDRRKRARQSR